LDTRLFYRTASGFYDADCAALGYIQDIAFYRDLAVERRPSAGNEVRYGTRLSAHRPREAVGPGSGDQIILAQRVREGPGRGPQFSRQS